MQEMYNGHSHSRMSSKLNYIPVLAHSPIIGPRTTYPEGPPKPPKVDRTKKPRSATERLFGENNPIRSSVTPERNGGMKSVVLYFKILCEIRNHVLS